MRNEKLLELQSLFIKGAAEISVIKCLQEVQNSFTTSSLILSTEYEKLSHTFTEICKLIEVDKIVFKSLNN